MARTIPCPDCGYNLAGLRGPTAVCPECGRRWTRAGIARASSRVPFWWLGALAATPVIMLGVGMTAAQLLGALPEWELAGPVISALVAGFVWNLFALRRARLLRPAPDESSRTAFLIVASEVLLAMGLAAMLGVASAFLAVVLELSKGF